MPYNYDFSTLENKKEISIQANGWVNPLIIEYGLGYHAENLSYFWKVKGTKHTFVIPVLRIDYLTEGNYAQHFQETLEGFKEDYKEWAKGGFTAGWMQEYRNDFSRFIAV
jgi:hypothetical protein